MGGFSLGLSRLTQRRASAGVPVAAPDPTGTVYTVQGLKPASSAVLYADGVQVGTTTVDSTGVAKWTLANPPASNALMTYDGTVTGQAGRAAGAGPSTSLGTSILQATAYKTGSAAGTVIGPIIGGNPSLVDDRSGAVAISGDNLVLGPNAPTTAQAFSVTIRRRVGNAYVDGVYTIIAATTTEAVAYFNRMTAKPASAMVAIIDTLIATLRASTAWAKLDWFYFYGQDSYQGAMLNMVGAHSLMVTGSPVFAARSGISGASGASLTNNIALGGGTFANYTQDSGHVGVYIKAAGTTTNPIVGMQGSSILQIQPKSASGNFGSRINNGTTLAVANSGTRVGHFSVSRTGPTAAASYRNGGAAAATNSTASAAITTALSPLYLFRDATAPVYSDDTVAAYHGGAGITQAENQTINDAITTAVNAAAALPAAPSPSATDFDVVIYGATLAGLMAAQRAANRGARVAIVEPTAEIGGVGHHGLTYFDLGLRGSYLLANMGTDRFFKAVNAANGQASPLTPAQKTEPKVYDQVFATTLAQTRATLILSSPLVTPADVRKTGSFIRGIKTANGWINGLQFIDSSYQLDLAVCAGAPYQVGRESASKYNEPSAGFAAKRVADGGWNYSTDGVTPNNLYPVQAKPAYANGYGDGLIQPISFRFPITTDASRLPFPVPPGGYIASKMDQVVATLNSKNVQQFTSVLYLGGDTALQNNKFCINASQANLFPTLELSGVQGAYPDGSPAQRQAVIDEIKSYTLHLLYCLQNDSRISASLRSSAAAYGLCADEFVNNPIPGFPNEPYFRETRRLIGQYVLTQNDVYSSGNPNNTSSGAKKNTKADRVGQWNYILDSHAMALYADGTNNIVITGNVDGRYQEVDTWDVPYAALHTDPAASGHVANLGVPLNFSASSIAWMTARLEPNFAQLGEAVGEAAMIAAEGGFDIASVPYDRLSRRIGSPIPLTQPTITGTGAVGQTLGGDNGTWDFYVSGYTYKWLRNGIAITNATSATYTTVAADAGTRITRVVIAANLNSSAQAFSADLNIAA